MTKLILHLNHIEETNPRLLIDSFNYSRKQITLNKSSQSQFHEIHLISNGNATIKLDDALLECKINSCIFLSPGKWREVLSCSDDIQVKVLIFSESFLTDFFHDQLFLYRFHYFYNKTTPSILDVDDKDNEIFYAIFNTIKKETKDTGFDSIHYLRSMLYYLLIALNRIYRRTYNISYELLNNTQLSIFKKILDSKIREYKFVGDYAHEMGISTSQLNAITTKYLGKNAGSIIRELRIAEAKRLILYTDLDIAEVANLLNFSEPSNFNRLFKTTTGLSPAQFRRNRLK